MAHWLTSASAAAAVVTVVAVDLSIGFFLKKPTCGTLEQDIAMRQISVKDSDSHRLVLSPYTCIGIGTG